MNCVDKMTKVTANESEMEEGEIVDELDDLSDISSEEEFLLRQRLEVLENYNNVLERKKAKRSSVGPGSKPKPKRDVLCDLSEISATELEDPHPHIAYKQIKVQRHVKAHNKQKRRKEGQQKVDENNARKNKDHQRKKGTRSKKRLGVKVLQSSDESEDEYRNKRKKLADAVVLHRGKNDKSSLSDRLHNMIHRSELHLYPEDEAEEYRNKRKKLGGGIIVHRSKNNKSSLREHKISHESEVHLYPLHKDMDIIITNNRNRRTVEETVVPISSLNANDSILGVGVPDNVSKEKNKTVCEAIELSTDDDVQIISIESQKKVEPYETIEAKEAAKECEVHLDKDSDEDLELLRQHALESKPARTKASEPYKIENKIVSEDEDSDTTELRLICLKSALLKKAIEMKRKQKLQKKLSQSSNLEDDVLNDRELTPINQDSNNNTDTESVDMDMGSDTEDKLRDCNCETDKSNTGLIARLHDSNKNTDLINCAINNLSNVSKEDELDDDEDLLRAKLLTSLSKNLTDLVNPEIKNTINQNEKLENPSSEILTKAVKLPEAKKFIIKLDESDSEGEHEATKNLTKMHMKLAEQVDFQQKLDQFLKSTRMEVEKTKPSHVQQPSLLKNPDKFVAKAVNHLPKSEQIEYKNLVRRMAELEKIKQTRQATINLLNQPMSMKDTLKPRNVTIENHVAENSNLEEQIAKSRKTIAEESAKMLKLKEEATKLSQRYKIAATELRNISTAITLNKKQQRTIQNNLSKIRSHHQSLLKSSTTSLHSKVNGRIAHLSLPSNKTLSYKLQKENNPKEEYKNPLIQKTVKVSVINDFVDEATINDPRMSVQLDITNNTKVVKIPNREDPLPDKILEVNHNIETEVEKNLEEQQKRLSGNNIDPSIPEVDKREEQTTVDADLIAVCDHGNKRYYISVDDYKSPLDALGATNWQADPNAILCPFEVGGQCKDPDCKYLHTPTPEQ